MIGLFSPSVSVQHTQQLTDNSTILAPLELSFSLLNTAEARGKARRPAHHGGNHIRPRPRPSTRPVHKDINRKVNRKVNKNVNVNVNHRYYGGYGHGYGYYGGRPILAFTTGLVIGSIIAASTMPKSCTTVMVGGVNYRQCGSSYYMPVYQGDTLVYKVVDSPY